MHPSGLAVDETHAPSRLAALMRTLDELLDEAARLRQEVGETLRRGRRPFWPERRKTNIPYDPDRRRQP